MESSAVAVVWRASIGVVLAIVIAWAAHRARLLTPSGVVAAIVVGALSMAAGWEWAAILLVFFLAGSLLSRVGHHAKSVRMGTIVEKGSRRDAAQVFANGGIFALAAAAHVVHPSTATLAAGAGAIAAAMADTCSTEIGGLSKRTPVSIFTGRLVAPGTSGGVTLLGTGASVIGAALLAALALALGWPMTVALAAFVGGVGGSVVDSLLGAVAQSRRWCDACHALTERRVHSCGTATRHVAGLRWLNNDGVNFACTLSGGLLALLLVR